MNRKASGVALLFPFVLSATACSAAPDQPVFGNTEYVYIKELGHCYTTKIDTGAGSASLNAINIKLDKGPLKGDDVVHFDLVLPDDSLSSYSLPVKKYIRVQRRAAEIEQDEKDYHLRPAVELSLRIGDIHHRMAVNLADRRDFSKPMLLGAAPLAAMGALVDVSQEFLQGDCPRAGETK